ncbi:hypothetical protein EAS54_06610 [Bradyrhizobium guangzhouense]|nr:hypothetical protein EAS54_06610 [Bradyrhizobium guangzhouense]
MFKNTQQLCRAHIALLVIYWSAAAILTVYAVIKFSLFGGFVLASFLLLAGTLGEITLIAIGILKPKPR